MAIFFETENFIVESHDQPFVSRTDGGHLRIRSKDTRITDRTKLLPKQAIELMRLTMIVGEALELAMNKQGIPVVKVNYQDMGNWAFKEGEKPILHIHVFGRAKNAVKQPYPESVYLPDRSTGFYKGFETLSEKDVQEIKAEMDRIFQEKRFSSSSWSL